MVDLIPVSWFELGVSGRTLKMSSQAVYPPVRDPAGSSPLGTQVQRKHPRHAVPPSPFRFPAYSSEGEVAQRQAELFYLQKQIQSQTPMVIVLEDGELIEGQIEWYDRSSLKVRGRSRTLIFKSAIKYMYKLGEGGQ
jgi:sRNA-binding regulator protein Hfq